MKKTVNFTANVRLDNPDYLRISAFAYDYMREVAFSVFNRVFSEDYFEDAQGGFVTNSTVLGPQAESLNDADTDFLITKEQEQAVQNGFRFRGFGLDKKVPLDGGSSKWRLSFLAGSRFMSGSEITPVNSSSSNASRLFGFQNGEEQAVANQYAHENGVFTSQKEVAPQLDLSNFVRALESDVPDGEKRFLKSIQAHTPTTFETSPFKTKVETFQNHGFQSGDYIKIVGTFPDSGSSTSSATWFQDTHRIEKLTNTEFLLYGSPTDTQAITVSVGPRCFRKKRFRILGAPSDVYDGLKTHPDDDLSDLRGVTSDFEPRKKMLVKTDVSFKEVSSLVGTRVKGVGYFKAEDASTTSNTPVLDDRFVPVGACVGYTDEFQTIKIPKNTRFTTILDEDLGFSTDNELAWQYHYQFPSDLSALGFDANYTVTFNHYDVVGDTPRDKNGTSLIESIQAIDKKTGGFKIQFVLNPSAIQTQTEDPEGGSVPEDIIVRFKLDAAYASPIILPCFGFDKTIGQHDSKTYLNNLFGGSFPVVWKGESFLAQGVAAEASPGNPTQFGNGDFLAQSTVGWDLPLWQKKPVARKRVFFSGDNRPNSTTYDIITEVTAHPSPAKETLTGSSPAAENSALDNGTFAVFNQTINYFDLQAAVLPEPDLSENIATSTNGQATVQIDIKEKSFVLNHDLCSFGEQRVSQLVYALNGGAGDLQWTKKGPNAIAISAASGATSFSQIRTSVNNLHVQGDLYLRGAVDGTFGGNRRQGSGLLASITNMRTQLASLENREKPFGGSFNSAVSLESNPALSFRQIAKRLQRIKTVLYKNGLVALDGAATTGDSTTIMASSLIAEHMGGSQGNAPLADDDALLGVVGEQIFKSSASVKKNTSSLNVLFPDDIKRRIERKELDLDPEIYLVILDILGSQGDLLQFSEADNPFKISNKTQTGFLLNISDTFSSDATVQYRICLPQKGDDLLLLPKAKPIEAPAQFSNFSGDVSSTSFNLNSFKSLKNNAKALDGQLDNLRNVLRNGQNVPVQWVRIDWKYLNKEDYGDLPPTLEIKGWSKGDKGFHIRPKIVFQKPMSFLGNSTNQDLGSAAGQADAGAAGIFSKNHSFRLRFYYGTDATNTSQLDAGRNYMNYDPGLGRLSPEPEFTDSPLVGNVGNQAFTPAGFARGLFITEKIRVQEWYYDDDGEQDNAAWPPMSTALQALKGSYHTQGGSGTETMPDGTKQYYVDYHIWLLRSYNPLNNTQYGQTLDQKNGGAVWTQTAPLYVLLIGRPPGVKFNADAETLEPAPGNPLYKDNGIT